MPNITVTDLVLNDAVSAVVPFALSDANVFNVAASGVTGISALSALVSAGTMIVGDYGNIDSGGTPIMFKWNGTEFMRTKPFGGTDYAVVIEDYNNKDPDAEDPAWVEAIGSGTGGYVDYNSSVPVKIGIKAGTTGNSSATSSKTFTAADSDAAGFVLRGIRCTASANNTQIVVPVSFAGTIKKVNITMLPATSATNWLVQTDAGRQDTGIAFGTSISLEVFYRADGEIRIFKDWAAAPSYSAQGTLLTTTDTSAKALANTASGPGAIEYLSYYPFTADEGI